MTSAAFIRLGFVLLLSLVSVPAWAADSMAPGEKAKVDALIAHIAELTDASFIRNGSAYDSKSAAKFLRGKWQLHQAEIKTAHDFIAKAGTVSSSSGQPYVIRFKGGKEVRCGEYLNTQLKKLGPGAKG